MHWTMADWRKVMFSDESTFRLVRGGYKLVRSVKVCLQLHDQNSQTP